MTTRSIHVVALLDPPSTRSLAQVPFIERAVNHRIHGFGPSAGPELANEEFQRVVSEGSALPVNITLQLETEAEPLAAGVLGSGFIDAYNRLALPPPETTTTAAMVKDLGWLWIDHGSRIEAARERWVLAAAAIAFRRRSFDVAELCQWAMPLHLHTSAAIWYTLPASLADEEVTFQVRLRRGQGDTTIDEATLRHQFEVIRDTYLAVP